MFKAIEKGKIIGINETGEFPLMNYEVLEEDTEHQLSDYIHYDGEFVLTSSAEAIEQKKDEVRDVRDNYLKIYVDDRAKSPFMWDEIPEEEKALIGEYRKYLLDYTEQESWYKINPLMFAEWKEELNATEQIETMGDVYGTNTSV